LDEAKAAANFLPEAARWSAGFGESPLY